MKDEMCANGKRGFEACFKGPRLVARPQGTVYYRNLPLLAENESSIRGGISMRLSQYMCGSKSDSCRGEKKRKEN